MNQKDFKKTINEILTEGKIEGKDIKNIDTLKYLLDDRKINKSLYDGFTKIMRWNMVQIVIIF